jgi:hypothetical protein
MDKSSEELVATLFIDSFLLLLLLLFYVPSKNARSHPDTIGHRPPYCERTSSVQSLVSRVYHASDQEIMRSCQVDGYTYLTNIRLLTYLVSAVSLVGLALLIPIYTQGDTKVDTDLNRLAVQHILDNEEFLWVVVLCWVMFSLMFYLTAGFFLNKVHSVTSRDYNSIKSQSVQLSRLPKTTTTNELESRLLDYFNRRFPRSLLSLYVVPDITEIYVLQLKLEKTQEHLASCQAYFDL